MRDDARTCTGSASTVERCRPLCPGPRVETRARPRALGNTVQSLALAALLRVSALRRSACVQRCGSRLRGPSLNSTSRLATHNMFRVRQWQWPSDSSPGVLLVRDAPPARPSFAGRHVRCAAGCLPVPGALEPFPTRQRVCRGRYEHSRCPSSRDAWGGAQSGTVRESCISFSARCQSLATGPPSSHHWAVQSISSVLCRTSVVCPFF